MNLTVEQATVPTPATKEVGEPDRTSREKPVIVIDGSAHFKRWCSDIRLYRGALYSLARRNIRSRYKQAALGMAWAVIQPALQVGVFTVFLGMLARVPTGDVPYPLFVLCGLIPWNLFAKIVTEGTTSLSSNQAMITKIFFPRIYLVVAAGSSAILDAIIALFLLLGLAVAMGHALGPSALLAVPALGGVVLLAYGCAALMAAINARWRDLQHTVPFLLQIGLFVTPALYQHTLVPERWRWVLALNPVTGFIEVFRGLILETTLPKSSVVTVSFGIALAVVALGLWYFRRVEADIVDIV